MKKHLLFIICMLSLVLTACTSPQSTPGSNNPSQENAVISPAAEEDISGAASAPASGGTSSSTDKDALPADAGLALPQISVDNSSSSSEAAPDAAAASEEGPARSDDGLLTREYVISLVLDRVPGASEKDFISFEQDYDDGRWQYEGELFYQGHEYEFEIDAQNGNILDWEID